MSIPADKIFLMLSHAAGFMNVSSIERVSAAGAASHREYLARLLAEAGERSLRQGLPHCYTARKITSRTLRGRLDFQRQVKADSRGGVSLCCTTDEAGHGSPVARILKAAAVRLASSPDVSDETAGRLRYLASVIEYDPAVSIGPRVFSDIVALRVAEVHQITAFVAWLAISDQGFADGVAGQVFGWPTSPQQSGLLFQEFVRRYLYRVCWGRGTVRSVTYAIPLTTSVESVRGILPALHTDIVLSSQTDILVVEVKLMPPLAKGRWSERADKLRADHLSQLLAYLEHATLASGGKARVRGMLFYGAAEAGVVARFPLGRHEVAVASVDFSRPVPQFFAEVARIADFFFDENSLGIPLGAMAGPSTVIKVEVESGAG